MQEYLSGLPFPTPGDLPHPGIETTSPASSVLTVNSLPLSHLGNPLNNTVLSIYTNLRVLLNIHVELSDYIYS